MPSFQSMLYRARFRLTGRKRGWIDTVKLDRSIRKSQRPGTGRPPDSLRREHDVIEQDVHGFPCFTVRPRAGAGPRHVLYLHGGAYVHPPEPEHWTFAATLARELRCAVSLPLYPLAPDHQYHETVPVAREVYDRIAADTDPADQVVMGDSAGGGLTLVLAQQLKAEGRPQPRKLVLLSPWLDITMTDPAVATLDRRDPYLSVPGLLEAARLYAGMLDHTDPLVSPIYGDVTGLGRLSVFTGSCDVLFGDARRLRTRTSRAGFPLDYFEYEDMFHGWMLQAHLPEARRATGEILDILRS